MENEEFYTILTNIGKAQIANAIALNTPIDIVKFHVGDGGGEYYNPTEEQTELKNKVWECSVNSVRVDENNPNWIVLEVVIPGDVGGFTIREVGAFDSEDNLIAIGKFPQTYKPNPTDGSLKELILKMVLEVSNTNCVVLKVDPTVILATKKDIDELSNKIDKLEDRLDKLKLVDTKVEFTDTENKFGFDRKTNINEALMKLKDDLDKAFQFGADVKQRVMSAINSKHTVPDVTIDDIWDTYIQSIIDIKEGRGDALTSHVLQGKTFTNHTGNLLTGTIPNRGGGQTITPGTGDKTLYSGYYSGNITILGDSDLVAENILGGKNIFGVNGSIPNRGNGKTITPTTADINLDYGYYATKNIIKGDTNLKPENIKKGVSIFGVYGSMVDTSIIIDKYFSSSGGRTVRTSLYFNPMPINAYDYEVTITLMGETFVKTGNDISVDTSNGDYTASVHFSYVNAESNWDSEGAKVDISASCTDLYDVSLGGVGIKIRKIR